MYKDRDLRRIADLSELQPYIGQGALERVMELGEIPTRGTGKYSFRNALERRDTEIALRSGASGLIFEDPIAAKRRRRMEAASRHVDHRNGRR